MPREEPQRQQGQQAQWCWGSLAPVQAFISPPTPGPGVSSLEWAEEPHTAALPFPHPAQARRTEVPGWRPYRARTTRSLAESLCSQPSLHPQPGSPVWEGGDASTGNMRLRTPRPHCSPRVFPCLLLPLQNGPDTADQDFMVQKPPEDKGRRGHWRPPPWLHLAALALCARWGRAGPAEGTGAQGETGSCSFTFLIIRTRSPGHALPGPAGLRGPEATGGSCVQGG